MNRLVRALVILLGICLLIVFQLAILGGLSVKLARLRSETAKEKIRQLPNAVGTEMRKPAPQPRSKRLDELLSKASKSLANQGPGGIPLLHPEDLFADYPELETTFLKAIEGHLRLKFASFFVRAGLTREQIDRYIEISMAGERDWIALTKEAASRGVPLSDQSIKALGRESANQRKQEMERLLGSSNLALREIFSEEREARNALTKMAAATLSGSNPISSDQLNHLTAMTTEIGLFDSDKVAKNPDIFAEASAKASAILSPEQQQLFDLMIEAGQARFVRAVNRRKSN